MHKPNKLLWFAFPYTLTFCKYIYKWKNKANKQKEMSSLPGTAEYP